MTADQITPGSWVRFDRHERWWFVTAARHTPLNEREPQTTGFVQYDAAAWPEGRPSFGGFADHRETCRIVTVTPEAVAA